MQLERNPRRQLLTAATLSLLGAATAPAQAAQNDWDFQLGGLYYAEGDGRVQAFEPSLSGSLDLGDQRLLSSKLTLDTLTGASPNGATPSSRPQTFSGASGKGKTYTVPAYQIPLDPYFKDTRVAGNLGYQFRTGTDGTLAFGIDGSVETDFLSLGANTRYSHDFNEGNTTLSAGLGLELDSISPYGGFHDPLSSRPASTPGGGESEDENENEGGGGGGGGSKSKTVGDLLLGLTQVLDRNSFLQLNYSFSQSSGYQTDPYKFLSVVGSDGEPLDYVYESRPGSRSRHALFLRYKRFVFGRDIVDLSGRYLTDSWGISSQTAEASYRLYVGSDYFLEPHFRWYTQTAADFYRVALFDGAQNTVDHASSDPRLSAFDAMTFGLKFGRGSGDSGRWSVRADYYQQASKITGIPDPAADGLAKFNLKSGDLSAVMVTFGYQFKW